MEKRLLAQHPTQRGRRKNAIPVVRAKFGGTVAPKARAQQIAIGEIQVCSCEVRDEVIRSPVATIADDVGGVADVMEIRAAETLTMDAVFLGTIAFRARTQRCRESAAAAIRPRREREKSLAKKLVAGVVSVDRIATDAAVLVDYKLRAPQSLVENESVSCCPTRKLKPVREIVLCFDV